MAEPIELITGTSRTDDTDGRRCEFCHSKLTTKGEVLEMSTRARELRTLEDRLLREQQAHGVTKNELVAAAQRVAELQAQIAAMQAPAAPPAESGTWGMS